MSDDERGPRETVYDEQISPLIKKIIAVCKEHSIPMLADFELDDGMPCTTAILGKDSPERLRRAHDVLRPHRGSPVIMVSTFDDAGILTNMTAIAP